MENVLHCGSCREEISSRSQNPNQRYCSKQACQNERKWQWKTKKREDPEYREIERIGQKAWRKQNPRYMEDYRKKNQKYVTCNRQQQRERNKRRCPKGGANESKQPKQAVSAPAKLRSSEKGEEVRVVIVNSDASNTLAAKGYLEWLKATGIVNGDASDPCVPMFLVPLSRLAEIVKETRGFN